MNISILIGRLTKDPIMQKTNSGREYCYFTVAVDRPYINQTSKKRDADFISVVAWDKVAGSVVSFMKQGSLVAVNGRIQTRNFERDGKTVYVTEVLANNVQFLRPKNPNSGSNGMYGPMDEPPMSNAPVSPYDFNNESESATQSVAQPTDVVSTPTMSVASSSDPFETFASETGISDNDLPF